MNGLTIGLRQLGLIWRAGGAIGHFWRLFYVLMGELLATLRASHEQVGPCCDYRCRLIRRRSVLAPSGGRSEGALRGTEPEPRRHRVFCEMFETETPSHSPTGVLNRFFLGLFAA